MDNMDFGLAIRHMYPNIDQSQYELIARQDGSVKIARWDPKDIPQPSETDVENFWNGTGMLDYFKTQKKAELSVKCNEAICGGFTSNALGAPHTYPSDEEAQRNFHSELDRIRLDSTYTTIYFKTFDAGYLAHTVDQFTKVFLDGHTYGRQQIAHLNDLKAQVDAATTVSTVNAITW
jgi:hypothetical protein